MCNRDVQLGTTIEHLPQYPKGLRVYPMLQEISKDTSVIDRIKDKSSSLNPTRCVIKISKNKIQPKSLLHDIRQHKTCTNVGFSLCSKEIYLNILIPLSFLESIKYFKKFFRGFFIIKVF